MPDRTFAIRPLLSDWPSGVLVCLLLLSALLPAWPALAGNDPGSWQLPVQNRIAAKMPMVLVHPRPEASSWSYSRNAHPGLRWEIPIVIQGGSWPFRHEIVDDGGAAGLQIGAELQRSAQNGFIVHSAGDDYGLLWWDTPVAGNYSILLRVHDQEGSSIDVPVSLTVGSAGWVFVDADNGSDSSGNGSINSPFRSIQRIHDGGMAFADHRVVLAGVVPMDGNSDGNLGINRNTQPQTPVVWVGWPGRSAVLEAYEGKISLTAPDFYLANLEHRHRSDFFQDHGSYIHMITVWGNSDRLTLHDVHFSRFQGNPVNADLGNSSVIMFTDQGSPRRHAAIVNNRISGTNGIFTSTYRLFESVFERNRAVGANFVTGEASTWAIFWIKRGNDFLSLRANEFYQGNTWGTPGNLSAAMGMDAARNIEFAYNTVHTPYDSAAQRRGAIKLFTNSSQTNYFWTTETPIWLYRNSLRHRLNYEGTFLQNMPEANIITERNILDPRAWPEHAFLLNIANLDQDTYFDANMKLAGSARALYLGEYGAEIASVDTQHVFADGFEE